MLFVIRQSDGQEIGIHADRLVVESSGNGKFRFYGTRGSSLELPARKVDYIRLIDEAWPDRSTAGEET